MNKLTALVATDFSPTSKLVFPTLQHLRQVFTLDVALVHVISSYWRNWFSSGLLEKSAAERLKILYEKSGSTYNPEKIVVLTGNPPDCIISLAEQLKVKYIFLGCAKFGSKGRYKTSHTVMGVARNAAQSVWICQSKSLKHLLCSIDGSQHSAKALKKAIELAVLFKAKLSVVSVIHRLDYNPLGLSDREIGREEARIKRAHIKKMETFLKKVDFENLEVKTFYPCGDPGEVIINMAEDLSLDLIVLGAKGHSLLRHLLLGSTTEKVLRYTPCSLLIVK